MKPVGKGDTVGIWKNKPADPRFMWDSWLFEEPWLKLYKCTIVPVKNQLKNSVVS